MKIYLYRASTLKYTVTFWTLFIAEVNFWRPPKTIISCDKFIREARTAPPTNSTNPTSGGNPLFPYFLEKRLVIPTSPFFHLLVNIFSVTCKNNNYHNHLLQTGFLGVYRRDRYITFHSLPIFLRFVLL